MPTTKPQAFKGPVPRCICGIDEDPTGRLPRVDIVCPKHDLKPKARTFKGPILKPKDRK